MRVLKTIVIGGVTFLLPLVLLSLLLAKAFQIVLKILEPIENLLPQWTVLGVAAPHLSAAILILVICFLTGLVVSAKASQRWRSEFERVMLSKVPGYAIARTLISGMIATDEPIEVALVEMENMQVIALVMERRADGHVTLFVPSAPTPAVGGVYFARIEQIRTIDVSLRDAMVCMSRLGLGAAKLLEHARREAQPAISA